MPVVTLQSDPRYCLLSVTYSANRLYICTSSTSICRFTLSPPCLVVLCIAAFRGTTPSPSPCFVVPDATMSNLSSEEVEEESIPGAWKEDKTGSHDDLDMGSPSSGRTTDAPPHAPESSGSASTNKRRRVTRACDECRRKKIKCLKIP